MSLSPYAISSKQVTQGELDGGGFRVGRGERGRHFNPRRVLGKLTGDVRGELYFGFLSALRFVQDQWPGARLRLGPADSFLAAVHDVLLSWVVRGDSYACGTGSSRNLRIKANRKPLFVVTRNDDDSSPQPLYAGRLRDQRELAPGLVDDADVFPP
ncbi:MAG TPA: hypothetical protein VKO16_09585 [Polyangia bacterium]|nr:hypothetical protein [Polyangia bacterium]